MLRADELLGVIFIYRHEIRPFTDSQIALMETFADQAAIAIESARLFSELQAQNADLTEALEQQTATGEILRVISCSPTDVQPVFDAIGPARRLCAAPNARCGGWKEEIRLSPLSRRGGPVGTSAGALVRRCPAGTSAGGR